MHTHTKQIHTQKYWHSKQIHQKLHLHRIDIYLHLITYNVIYLDIIINVITYNTPLQNKYIITVAV